MKYRLLDWNKGKLLLSEIRDCAFEEFRESTQTGEGNLWVPDRLKVI